MTNVRKIIYQNILCHHMYAKHNGEKPYKCDECPRTFSYHSSRAEHVKTHRNEKLYLSEFCDKSFR